MKHRCTSDCRRNGCPLDSQDLVGEKPNEEKVLPSEWHPRWDVNMLIYYLRGLQKETGTALKSDDAAIVNEIEARWQAQASQPPEARLIAPIKDLIAYHEQEAKNHVSSQWIYSNHMYAVNAYKKVLNMLDELPPLAVAVEPPQEPKP